MNVVRSWARGALVLAALALVVGAATAPSTSASASASTAHYAGTLSDGATWVADVPSNWNGTLLLFSHGYGPPVVQEPLAGAAQDALLERGYALAGSSYDPAGSWWALQSAVRDQFETIEAVSATALPHEPRRVLAVGTSMGGLISALEAQESEGRIDGALTTCGIVAGAIHLNNYQLDGAYTMAKLLAPGQPIKLVNFLNMAEGAATGAQLTAVAREAQETPQGRARLALALAFLNAPPAASGLPIPNRKDAEGVQAAQFAGYFGSSPTMVFIEAARPSIEQSAGGNGSWTLGEDFAKLLEHSPYRDVVQSLYRKAGLDMKADLKTLTAGARIPADPAAVASLQETSVPTGHLDVPALNLHTIYDHLVPVEQEETYARLVRTSGGNNLLRQAYVDRIGHCNFTAGELVAGVEALGERVETGRWGSVAEPRKLQERAESLGLGEAAFVGFRPAPLSGDNGPFDPNHNS
jgi:hypothetical protein